MMLTLTRAALTLALLGAAPSMAGGLWLNEFGDFAGGRASAGAAAGTDEAATIIHNPASAAGATSNQLFASAGYLMPEVEFDVRESGPFIGDDDGGQAGEPAAVSSMAYVNDFGTERWDFGIYVAGLAGAGIDYGEQWVGRYQATRSELLVLAVAPTAAWQVNDKLALGIGPQFYYADLELDVNVPALLNPGGPDNRASLDGDDTGFGFMAGLTWQWDAATRLGLTYQSELDIKFDGDLELRSGIQSDLDRQTATDTELTLAAKVRAGLQHTFSDRLNLYFSLGWDEWSALDNVLVNVAATGGGASLNKNWDDTWHYGAGFQYAVNKHWDMTMGAAYDTNPVDAHDRTADLPVDRQVRFNVGTRYHLSDALSLGGFVNYTDLGDARISGPFWSGEYDGSSEFWQVALNLNWKL